MARVLDESELRRTMANLLGVDESDIVKVTARQFEVDVKIHSPGLVTTETRVVHIG